MENNLLLEVNDLYIHYRSNPEATVKGVSFAIPHDSIVGIIGESGSGKSTTALAISGLLTDMEQISQGEILYKGKDILKMSSSQIQKLRGNEISMIYQDSQSSLDPLMKIGKQVSQMVKFTRNTSWEEAKDYTNAILKEVGFDDVDRVKESYPYELSGGMRQRVLVAIASVANPSLLIADEPTTALDVTTEAKILKLLKKLQGRNKSSILMISHDLGVIKEFCDYIYVMKDGVFVESGPSVKVMENPQHDYTKHLISIARDLYR